MVKSIHNLAQEGEGEKEKEAEERRINEARENEGGEERWKKDK